MTWPAAARISATLACEGTVGLPSPLALRTRYYVEYLAFRLVAAVFGALPLERAARVSGLLWRIVAPRLPRHARALENLARAYPEKSPAERERIALAMWRELGQTFAEFFHLATIRDEKRLTLATKESFAGAVAPFVVCIPHLGNWEVASLAASQVGVRAAGTYQALTNPLVDAWLHARRAPMYAGGLYAKSSSTARVLMRLPREGVCLSFVADLRQRNGVPVQFFGRDAMSNPFPAIVARTLGLPIYAGCVVRTAPGRFEMHMVQVETTRTEDRDADVLAITQAVHSLFENFVRRWPEQWMWAHKRWDL